jgi:hypothetical protein
MILGGKWLMKSAKHNLEGVGCFVIDLAADVKIKIGEALRIYVKEYEKKYFSKL